MRPKSGGSVGCFTNSPRKSNIRISGKTLHTLHTPNSTEGNASKLEATEELLGSGEQRQKGGGSELPRSIMDWPGVAKDFAIAIQQRALAAGSGATNETANRTIQRSRVWWRVSTIKDRPKTSRRCEDADTEIERAVEVLGSHGVRLQRGPEGYRLKGDCEAAEVTTALKVMGLDHLSTQTKELSAGGIR